ncbi:hypothetical protein [Nocardiopsis baichengensis]|uniref:hypothetical protein n=1 Tax=Nocardiopsis baichengensis TaxID=280240 RepID=UPI00034C9D3A|nr:hypothetical protein [Nocardiopsis baichengensis]
MKGAAVKKATAELVDVVAVDDRLLEQVARLGEHLSGAVRAEAMEIAKKQPPVQGREADPERRTLGHFWCSLLAEMSGALDKVADVGDAPLEFAEGLSEEGHPFLDESQKDLAVLCVKAVLLVNLSDPILIMRIMAVFMCPDPARHPQIAKQCLFPLVGEAIGGDAAASLRRAFGDPEAE